MIALLSVADITATRAIVRDVLQVSDEALDRKTLEELGCDQLCNTEIAIAIEDAFGIEISGEAAWCSLSNIYTAVAAARGVAA